MAIIQKINNFVRKKYVFFANFNTKTLRVHRFNPIIILSFLIVFSVLFFISSNLIENNKKKNSDNFEEVTRTVNSLI
jgi:hypothetical protein